MPRQYVGYRIRDTPAQTKRAIVMVKDSQVSRVFKTQEEATEWAVLTLYRLRAAMEGPSPRLWRQCSRFVPEV